jgi:hypothetical protein
MRCITIRGWDEWAGFFLTKGLLGSVVEFLLAVKLGCKSLGFP